MHHIDLPARAVERGHRAICFDFIEPTRTALLNLCLNFADVRDTESLVALIEDGAPRAEEKSGADHAA